MTNKDKTEKEIKEAMENQELVQHIKENYLPDIHHGVRPPKPPDSLTATVAEHIYTSAIEALDQPRRAAKVPRERDYLNQLIDSYLIRNSNITLPDVIQNIKDDADPDKEVSTIISVWEEDEDGTDEVDGDDENDKIIKWRTSNGVLKKTKLSAIKDRFYRAKKKHRSR